MVGQSGKNTEKNCKPGQRVGRQCAMFLVGCLLPALALAQHPCIGGVRIDGVITDPTGAVISGARVESSAGVTVLSDAAGRYLLACEPGSAVTITAEAAGFARAIAHVHVRMGGFAHVDLRLSVAAVKTDVVVDGDAGGVDGDAAAGSTVLTKEAIEQLSDDPDDLLRELQTMAAAGGGATGSAIVSVDGFHNGSPLPPKGSIAKICINPDTADHC
jgi:Carboxypeptidase regulatory-like domain